MRLLFDLDDCITESRVYASLKWRDAYFLSDVIHHLTAEYISLKRKHQITRNKLSLLGVSKTYIYWEKQIKMKANLKKKCLVEL